MMTQAVRISKAVETSLQVYHSRQQRREFARLIRKISPSISPAVLRAVYTELTGDATAPENKDIEYRIKQAMVGEDPDLVVDLRHLNKGIRFFKKEMFY